MANRDDGQAAGTSSGTQHHTPSPPPSSQTSMSNFLRTGSGSGGGSGNEGGGSAETQPAVQATDVQKLRFPSDVPADVRAAVLGYQPPPGHTIDRIHNVTSKPSFICFWGVRVYTMVNGKKKSCYKCMANHKCRVSPKLLSLAGSTTGATEHLKNVHKTESPTSADDQQKKYDTLDKIDQVKQSKIYTSDKVRHNMLGVTKAFIIYGACPFRLVEQAPVRHCFGVMVPRMSSNRPVSTTNR
ncbi:unnamed protein product [Ectocarpus sp. 4 AP-2014]